MVDSIGSNIISTLGAGSGINSRDLADQLTEIEKSAKQTQIDTSREKFETQISDLGTLRSALATLQDSAELLKESATFNSKTANFTDSDAFIPLELDEDVATGTYSFEVLDVAQSQSLSSGGSFSDPSDAVGKGTLAINFGSWDTGVPPTTFTQNTDKDGIVITIDDDNNSLTGLKNAINDADAGVTASIINDGGGYRLLLTAESGLSNQLEITATEDALSPGLAGFDFNATTQAMSQEQAGKDARVKINGLEVSRSANEIDDVLEGFTFNLAKADPGNLVTVTISEDKAGGEQAIRDFVDTFNAFLEAVEPVIGFNEEEDEYGSLYRDPAARSVKNQIRNLIAAAVPGLDSSGYTSLTNIGVRTELDGTLAIDEDDLRLAIDDNYDLVKAFFNPQTSSSSEQMSVNSFRDDTVPGSYEVELTAQPSKGGLVGAAASGTLLADLATPSTSGSLLGGTTVFAGGLDLLTQGKAAGSYDFDLSVDGADAVTISLPIADYADENAVAAALQTELDAAGVEADISFDTDHFVIASRAAGDNSSVVVSNPAADAGEFDWTGGSTIAGTGPNADDYSFTVNVDGKVSSTLTVALGSYADEDELAAHIQSLINSDETLKAAGAAVDVVWSVDHFELTSRTYGEKSRVSVTDVGGSASDLGLDAGVASSGTDVAGTWNGVAGFGVGNVLLPKLNTDPSGLSLLVKPGATSTTVNYSRGFGSELSALLESFVSSSGTLSQREDSLDSNIEKLDDDQETLDRRMDAYHERLMAQFQAMERIVNSINSSGSSLDDLADRLPFTASSS